MKIYSIRDRMLNYFRTPFLAPNDNEVQAAISVQLIRGEQLDWKETPHQFELWSLGGVDQEEGTIQNDKELICTLDSLVRHSVRAEPDERAHPAGHPPIRMQGTPERTSDPADAKARTAQSKAPAKARTGKKAPRRHRGSN